MSQDLAKEIFNIKQTQKWLIIYCITMTIITIAGFSFGKFTVKN